MFNSEIKFDLKLASKKGEEKKFVSNQILAMLNTGEVEKLSLMIFEINVIEVDR